jgi:hypothetical protein
MPSFSVESFINALQSVWHARDTERSSPILMTVNVQCQGDDIVVAATDGKILGEWTINAFERPSSPEFEFPVGTNINIVIPKIAVLKPFSKNMKNFSVKIDTRVITLANNESSVTFQLIEGSFPPYKPALERPIQNFEDFHGDSVIGMNMENMDKVGKVLSLEYNCGVYCEFHGYGRGMIFRPIKSFREKRVALVMPITLSQR